eukprot:GHVR01112040.1.p1 GENE.GHVR01112040.1~~GHVR01112040.1.p1  ORF type:complete len:563 (+),score=40.10 GHVR01112040.1:108-1691(+)
MPFNVDGLLHRAGQCMAQFGMLELPDVQGIHSLDLRGIAGRTDYGMTALDYSIFDEQLGIFECANCLCILNGARDFSMETIIVLVVLANHNGVTVKIHGYDNFHTAFGQHGADLSRDAIRTGLRACINLLLVASMENGKGLRGMSYFMAGIHTIVEVKGGADGDITRAFWQALPLSRPEGTIAHFKSHYNLTTGTPSLTSTFMLADFGNVALKLALLHSSLHAVFDRGSKDSNGRHHLSMMKHETELDDASFAVIGEHTSLLMDITKSDFAPRAATYMLGATKEFCDLMNVCVGFKEVDIMNEAFKIAAMQADLDFIEPGMVYSPAFWVDPSCCYSADKVICDKSPFTIIKNAGTKFSTFGDGAIISHQEGELRVTYNHISNRQLGIGYLFHPNFAGDNILESFKIKTSHNISKGRISEALTMPATTIEDGIVGLGLDSLYWRSSEFSVPHPQESKARGDAWITVIVPTRPTIGGPHRGVNTVNVLDEDELRYEVTVKASCLKSFWREEILPPNRHTVASEGDKATR